ncbi:MAG: hypothetical protein WCQ90_04295, partial [Deltaproteobacteria bacterium]
SPMTVCQILPAKLATRFFFRVFIELGEDLDLSFIVQSFQRSQKTHSHYYWPKALVFCKEHFVQLQPLPDRIVCQ